MSSSTRIQPTRHRPVAAWCHRNADGSLGTPVVLNPMQALALSDELPDPVTLAELGYFRGLEGLGRFAMEHATNGALTPGGGAEGVGDAQDLELGEFGFLPALVPFLVPLAQGVIAGAASALAAKGVGTILEGVDDVHRRDRSHRGALADANLANQPGIRPGHAEADLLSGMASSSLAGVSHPGVGKLGIFGRLRRKRQEEAKGPGLASRVTKGTKAGLNLLSIGKNLLNIRNKLKSGKRINASEVLRFIRGMVKQANQLLGGPGEREVVSHLAGVAGALDSLERVDRALRTDRRLGWRPTLGEYGSACCRCAMRDPRLREFARAIQTGVLDPRRKETAAMQAAQTFGVKSGQELSSGELGQLGAAGDFLQALANGAVELLQDVQRMPVERAVLQGARTVLNDLVGATQQAQAQTIRVNDTDQRLQQFRDGAAELQRRREQVADLPTQQGIDQELARLRDLTERAERVKAQGEAQLAEMKALIDEKRRAAAPVASMVKAQAEAAMKVEQNRIDQVNDLSERGMLRGQVMVLSRTEYADLIRTTNEAKSAHAQLRQLAETADKERKATAARLADANVRIVQLKQQLADLNKRAVEQQKQREINEAIERNREEMADRLRLMQDGFRSQLQQVRDQTREAVNQAGDVVNRTGVQMMFQFVRDLTDSMRNIRDVSHAGEFIRLFPEVLDQLRTAQDIAAPKDPVINVTVPQQPAQPAPVVNVDVAPPTVNVEPPQFVLGPDFTIRPRSPESSDSAGGGQPNFVLPPIPANAV